MENKLAATPRTVTGKQVGQLRRQGLLPAVIYGPGTKPQSIQLNTREASKVLRRVHGAELIDLELGGETRKVLVHDRRGDLRSVNQRCAYPRLVVNGRRQHFQLDRRTHVLF